jgi:hypothetical protein
VLSVKHRFRRRQLDSKRAHPYNHVVFAAAVDAPFAVVTREAGWMANIRVMLEERGEWDTSSRNSNDRCRLALWPGFISGVQPQALAQGSTPAISYCTSLEGSDSDHLDAREATHRRT